MDFCSLFVFREKRRKTCKKSGPKNVRKAKSCSKQELRATKVTENRVEQRKKAEFAIVKSPTNKRSEREKSSNSQNSVHRMQKILVVMV